MNRKILTRISLSLVFWEITRSSSLFFSLDAYQKTSLRQNNKLGSSQTQSRPSAQWECSLEDLESLLLAYPLFFFFFVFKLPVQICTHY